MTNNTDECQLYGALRSQLRSDLVSEHGFSNPEAGRILNYFDPADCEYLEHVDAWQRLLCQGAILDDVDLPIVRKTCFGSNVLDAPVHMIGAIHQVAKLVYKWHGVPRRKTNMEEVKLRLSQPLPMTLGEFEIGRIRDHLKTMVAPDLNSVVGRFGPGETAESLDAFGKWHREGRDIPDVPLNLYRCNSRDPWMPAFGRTFWDACTRIGEVPKSIKSNRIVSSEPAMYMWAQLAVADDLVSQLHAKFASYVSLDDAKRHNQALNWRDACSVDLSDASDHVSCSLVQAVLPQLWPVLAKVRSSYACFPDGDVVPLGTFAPMGSGVCFPVLTLVVLGIALYAIESTSSCSRDKWVHVYGDDVIIPLHAYDFFVDLLTRAGLVVNIAKSCCTRIYRESCGRELYAGADITPNYIRDPLEEVPASKIEQLASGFQSRLFPKTAEAVMDMASAAQKAVWNSDLQRLEVCVRTISARQKVRTLDGWDGLNRWFSVGSQQEIRVRKDGTFTLPSGVTAEVWTKPAWRYQPSWDYPTLTHWLVTRCFAE